MRRESAAVVLVILVAAAAAGTALAELDFGSAGKASTDLGTSSLTEVIPSNCTTTFPGGLPIQQPGNNTRMFALLPGSTGLICVTYTVNELIPLSSNNTSLRFVSNVYSVTATYENQTNGEGSGYSYSYHLAPGLSDSASPPSVNLPLPSGDSFTVVYSIAASGNATGFYSLSFTSSCPSLIPFAVTSDGRGVTPSDFPGFFSLACAKGSIFSQVLVTGIADVNTTLLFGQ